MCTFLFIKFYYFSFIFIYYISFILFQFYIFIRFKKFVSIINIFKNIEYFYQFSPSVTIVNFLYLFLFIKFYYFSYIFIKFILKKSLALISSKISNIFINSLLIIFCLLNFIIFILINTVKDVPGLIRCNFIKSNEISVSDEKNTFSLYVSQVWV